MESKKVTDKIFEEWEAKQQQNQFNSRSVDMRQQPLPYYGDDAFLNN